MAITRQSSSAYNLPERQAEERLVKRETSPSKLRELRQEKKFRVSFSAVAMGAISVALTVAILYFNLVLTAYTDRVWVLNDKLDDLKSEEVFLKSEYERINSLSYIEEVAQNNLGMTKMNKAQIEYIDLENPDSIEAISKSGNIFSNVVTNISNSFTAILEYFT